MFIEGGQVFDTESDEYDVDFNEMRYSAGMEIELPEHDAQWLKNLKVAEDIKTSAMVTKPTEDK